MSDKTTVSKTGGIGFAGLLTILFIGLKLTHNVDWSWWWVLSPLWIPTAACLAFIVFCALVVGLIEVFSKKKTAAGKR